VSTRRFELRAFLDCLAAAGQLAVRDEPCDLADVAAALDGNERAVLFRKVGPEQAALAAMWPAAASGRAGFRD
jgi:hypothetical protein